MTKHELIKALIKRTSLNKRQVENTINSLVDIITEKMKKGEKVTITGFGTFHRGRQAARRGVDPRTKKEIHIPQMAMPRFRAGKRLKDNIRI